MFQSTLTGKVVMFQEYLMIASKPRTMVGKLGNPNLGRYLIPNLRKKLKREKIKIYKSSNELFTNQIQFL